MAPETARLAVKQGYTRVFLFAQGLKGWTKMGLPVESAEKIPDIPVDRIPPAGVKAMLNKDSSVVLLDIRDDGHFNQLKFDVPEVLHIPTIDLLDDMETIPPDRKIVLACHQGKLSPKIAPLLKSKGYDVVGFMEGGITAWKEMGLPVI